MPLSAALFHPEQFPGGLLFTLTREFNAPPKLLWKLHTEPDHLTHWWGSKNSPITIVELNLTRGGNFRYHQQSSGGPDIWCKWTYQEIEPADHITHFITFTDANGKPIRSPLTPIWPVDLFCKISFPGNTQRTTINLSIAPWNASEQEHQSFHQNRLQMKACLNSIWNRLDTYLANLKTTSTNPTTTNS